MAVVRTGLALAVLAALTLGLFGCGRSGGSGEDEPTQALKASTDDLARDLLPDLDRAVGGTLSGRGRFFERDGFGLWDYTIDGSWSGVQRTKPEIVRAVLDVLSAHGLDARRTEVEGGSMGIVEARSGDIVVEVTTPHVGDDEPAGSVSLTIANPGGVRGSDYAESTPDEDVAAFLDAG